MRMLAETFEETLDKKGIDVVMWPRVAGPTWIATCGGFPIARRFLFPACDSTLTDV